jgi:hypothetical protein
MRGSLVALGALVVVAITLLWPPRTVIHISHDPSVSFVGGGHSTGLTTVLVGMSALRAAIVVIAVLAFLAGMVAAFIPFVRRLIRRRRKMEQAL